MIWCEIFQSLWLDPPFNPLEFFFCPMTNKRRSREELKEVGALVERLRDYIQLNYTTAAEIARQIGIAPTGYEYREYKNWRGISKPRRCPFCKQVKGEIQRSRGGFLGVCPNCGATGPKRESHEEALRAWNGEGN